jgi:glycosyltransferase involved in cell wall biosynthesis
MRLWIAALFLLVSLDAVEKPFCIVVPSRNNRSWYIQNLDSIFDQKYKNFRVIYIDDASTDGTAELVEAYVRQRGARERFTLIRNKEKQGPLACTCGAVFLCGKEEIVVDLDGNDWLAHEGVLSCLNELYQDPDVWMTYGQFLRYPRYTRGSAFEVPEEVIEENRFRSFGGAVTHLKTFYAALFQEVDKGDFLFEGKFIEKAGDMAYALPLLEMAGRRICFVPEVLYVYNEAQPLNEHKVPDDLEAAMDRYIRSKKPYLPLDELPRQKLEPIYTQIEDLFHPTLHDYQFIQDYLSFGRREKLDLLGDMEARMRALKIIGKRPEEFPKSGTIAVNSTIEKKENCLLVYSTFNERYPKGLERLIEDVRHSDFKGHILFRLGGWPDSEGGSLALSHVPYGFKVSFFNEARRLGYKRALWLDAAVVPLVSLNEIFRAVEERGLFVMGNSHAIGPYLNAQSAAFFGLNLSSTYRIPSCSAGLFGIDFTQPIGKRVFDWWRSAAFDKDAFFSVRSDQSALSAILYQCGVADFVDLDKMPHSADAIRPDSLFWLDREFVH